MTPSTASKAPRIPRIHAMRASEIPAEIRKVLEVETSEDKVLRKPSCPDGAFPRIRRSSTDDRQETARGEGRAAAEDVPETAQVTGTSRAETLGSFPRLVSRFEFPRLERFPHLGKGDATPGFAATYMAFTLPNPSLGVYFFGPPLDAGSKVSPG